LLAPTILLAYVGAFRGAWSRRLFTLRGVTLIGGMCYSMYLLHYFVISLAGVLAQSLHLGSTFLARLAIEGVIALPAVLALTCLYFVWLERPCMDARWPERAISWLVRLKRTISSPEAQ
jgi:peptidoglycan/LPS O-acetylase OafA/YrhL